MGAYIFQSDIEAFFGTENVISWSNLDNNEINTANTTRIEKAITIAEDKINDKFRGGAYAIPFSPVPNIVKDWAAKLAGMWLYDARGHRGKSEQDVIDKYIALKGDIENEMAEYAASSRKLNARRAQSMPNAPFTVT